MKIEFVSYTGKYPNLCSGVLTLLIDGEEIKFGHDCLNWDYNNRCYKDSNYDSFWTSGGSCYFDNEWNDYVIDNEWNDYVIDGEWIDYVIDGEWIIDKYDLPNWLQDEYEKIKEVFNENVEYGCCGGCI